MIAAMPNAGKSMFALDLVIEWVTQHGLWAYYFSADTDEGDVRRRAAARLTGETVAEVEEGMEEEGPDEWYFHQLEVLEPLRWAFKTDPDFAFIHQELDAYDEAFGAHPDVIVVDNALNFVGDEISVTEKTGMLELQGGLKELARTTGAAILLLHHMSESGGADPRRPAPRSAIQNKVSEIPEMVLSIAYDDVESRFGVAGVKNRGAKADPKAERPVWLNADLDRVKFEDMPAPVWSPTQYIPDDSEPAWR